MEVVTGAMSTLLPKLGDLLKEEYELQTGVKGEIMFLKAELESMQAALLKVSEAPVDQPPDIQVKLWARDVKELSYDVEDIIDAFMVRVGTRAPKKLHGLRGFINRSLNLLTIANVRHKIGTDIKDIKRRTMEVSERRDRYKVDNVVAKPVSPTIDSLRLSALYIKATELVGTKKKSDGLIKSLMEGDEASKQKLKIVSIVGFGGLGKTTLANVVYQQLKEQFDCGAFISVSLNPNMEKIFKNILRQLDKDKYSQCNIDDEAQLINELRDFFRNKSGRGRLLSPSSILRRRRRRTVRDRTKPEMRPPTDTLVQVSPEDPRTVESRRIEPIGSLPLLEGSRHGLLCRPTPRLNSRNDGKPPGDMPRRCGGPRR